MTPTDRPFDAFGEIHSDDRFVKFLNRSAFDELIKINLAENTMQVVYHAENKFFVPALEGDFRNSLHFSLEHIVHPDDKAALVDFWELSTLKQRVSESRIPGTLQIRLRQKLTDGSWRWVEYLLVIGTELGVEPDCALLYIYDIQNQKNRESGISPESRIPNTADELTGLRTGDSFFSTASRMAADGPEKWCCLAIDIERFKLFNDLYGREKGNLLLAAFGDALRRLESPDDCIAGYMRQDDFIVFMRYAPETIRALYQDLRSIVASYGNTSGFQPAIGVYRMSGTDQADLDMYDRALSALTEAKKLHSDRIHEYDFAIVQQEKADYQLLLELQRVVSSGEVTFFLQPQCRISTGKIVGAEALVRWVRPDGTMVPPGRFIPLLEQKGFITDLDKIIWEMVCKWLRAMLDKGIALVPVSINVSQIDILTMDVVSYLYALTQRYNLPTKLLKVEITESAYASQSEIVQNFVTQLSEKGFLSMMDDFGSGYSSLNMLETVNVDVLKLDMAFMRTSNMNTRKGITIVESIINMAKMMDLSIVVEGVENEEQVRFLTKLGCRYAQGYYFYRPMPLSEFEKLISNREKLDFRGFLRKANEQFHVREFLDETTFTDSLLNNILGAVALYSYDGKDLTITRFNQQFYHAIGDPRMESRQIAIQNYVVEEDHPALFSALENAYNEPTNGGLCEIRFYKSDGGVFWFHMHLFYLKNENERRIYYGQIEDVTEIHMQSLQFFDVLRKQSDICLRINLNRNTVQYILPENSFTQTGLPSIAIDDSFHPTAENRIDDPAERQRFLEFFDSDRLREIHRRGIYHETFQVSFRLFDQPEPVEFSTYYLRHSREQDLMVYVFSKAKR